jgi:hypothetical protein
MAYILVDSTVFGKFPDFLERPDCVHLLHIKDLGQSVGKREPPLVQLDSALPWS